MGCGERRVKVEFGDVAWKISSDFKRRLMIDDLSGLLQEVTALPHLCHRHLFPKGFVKKKEREKGRWPTISKAGES